MVPLILIVWRYNFIFYSFLSFSQFFCLTLTFFVSLLQWKQCKRKIGFWNYFTQMEWIAFYIYSKTFFTFQVCNYYANLILRMDTLMCLTMLFWKTLVRVNHFKMKKISNVHTLLFQTINTLKIWNRHLMNSLELLMTENRHFYFSRLLKIHIMIFEWVYIRCYWKLFLLSYITISYALSKTYSISDTFFRKIWLGRSGSKWLGRYYNVGIQWDRLYLCFGYRQQLGRALQRDGQLWRHESISVSRTRSITIQARVEMTHTKMKKNNYY